MIDTKKMSDGMVAAVKQYNALKCSKCGFVRHMNDGQKARYFAHGWPEHCGCTMSLHVATPPTKGEEGR